MGEGSEVAAGRTLIAKYVMNGDLLWRAMILHLQAVYSTGPRLRVFFLAMFFFLALALVGLVELLFYVETPIKDNWWYLGVFVFLFLPVAAFLQYGSSWIIYRRFIASKDNEYEVEVRLNEETFHVITPAMNFQIKWEAVSSAVSNAQLVLILPFDEKTICVPREAFSKEYAFEQLREWVESKVEKTYHY